MHQQQQQLTVKNTHKPTVAIIPALIPPSNATKPKRAKSLEQILNPHDSSSSDGNGENGNVWIEERGGQSRQQRRQQHHQLSSSGDSSSAASGDTKKTTEFEVSSASDASTHHQPPSYCTIDRSRLRRQQAPQVRNSASQTLPRKPARKTLANKKGKITEDMRKRSRSVDVLDRRRSSEEDATTTVSYIGDLGGLDELRRVTSEYMMGNNNNTSIASPKTVTIHPSVTEFHYPGMYENNSFLYLEVSTHVKYRFAFFCRRQRRRPR